MKTAKTAMNETMQNKKNAEQVAETRGQSTQGADYFKENAAKGATILKLVMKRAAEPTLADDILHKYFHTQVAGTLYGGMSRKVDPSALLEKVQKIMPTAKFFEACAEFLKLPLPTEAEIAEMTKVAEAKATKKAASTKVAINKAVEKVAASAKEETKKAAPVAKKASTGVPGNETIAERLFAEVGADEKAFIAKFTEVYEFKSPGKSADFIKKRALIYMEIGKKKVSSKKQ